MYKMNPIRQLTMVFLLLILAFSVTAEEKEQTTIYTSETEYSEGNSDFEKTELSEEVVYGYDKSEKSKKDSGGHIALKTNFLAYAIILPNIEFEWLCANHLSVAIEWEGNWIAKKTPHKVYRIAMATPEVRFWAVDKGRWNGMYVGVFGGVGMYDLHNGRNGHKGEGFMAGASIGYMWPIGERLSLDAGLGLGYMYLRDKVYTQLGNHFLYQFTKHINYWGPLRLKLSLVWRL